VSASRDSTASSAPKQGERRNRDQEVMAAAVRIFFEKGYSAASLQDVATEVGVLKGSLYYYFASKEELLLRIMKESHAQSEQISREIEAMGLSAIDELSMLLEALMKWYLGNVERVAIYFNERTRLTGTRLEDVAAEGRRFEQRIYDLLAAAKEDGAFAPDLDLRLSVRLFLGALNSVPNWHKPGQKHRMSDSAIAQQFASMTLKSIAP
jgi:TetR/AcrR family transcriptional regulator, cholesterol catabolism regulator